MYPNQQPQSDPLAYLDSIAVKPAQPTVNPAILWAMIGGFLLVIITIGFMLLNSGGPSNAQRLTDFMYRVNSLQKLSSANAKNVQSSQLLAENAQLTTILTGISQQSATPLANNGVKTVPTTPPATAPITSEYAKINSTLDDARLNVNFDPTYARVITYQIRTIRSEMTTLYKATKSTSLKSFLETSDKNLKPLEDDFSNFNDAV